MQAEIIAIKESYRHGQKKLLGAILELAHHLVLQNEWNIKIIFSEQKYKKLREAAWPNGQWVGPYSGGPWFEFLCVLRPLAWIDVST